MHVTIVNRHKRVSANNNATFYQNIEDSTTAVPVTFKDDNNNTIIFDATTTHLGATLIAGDAKNILVLNDDGDKFALNDTDDVLSVAGKFTAKDLSVSAGNFADVDVIYANSSTYKKFDGYINVIPQNSIKWLNNYIDN